MVEICTTYELIVKGFIACAINSCIVLHSQSFLQKKVFCLREPKLVQTQSTGSSGMIRFLLCDSKKLPKKGTSFLGVFFKCLFVISDNRTSKQFVARALQCSLLQEHCICCWLVRTQYYCCGDYYCGNLQEITGIMQFIWVQWEKSILLFFCMILNLQMSK